MPEIVAVLLVAIAVVTVWYLAARYVAILAVQREQDPDYWFRAALMITPMIALWLLLTRTPPPGGRR